MGQSRTLDIAGDDEAISKNTRLPRPFRGLAMKLQMVGSQLL